MGAVIMADLDLLVVRDSEIDADDGAAAAAPKLAHPLVRDGEIAGDGHGVDAAGAPVAMNAAAADRGDITVRGEVNEHGHGSFETIRRRVSRPCLGTTARMPLAAGAWRPILGCS